MSAAIHTEPHVIARRDGSMSHITLNRPRALNALTTDMVVAIRAALEQAQGDGSTAVLLDGAGDRGFCGGGDVKAMVAGGLSGAQAFIREEYATDLALHTSSVPVVGIMDGITMGGGIGLTGHAAVRVVTERSRLAMPETRIGIVPDVGSNALLAVSPGRLGDYLAASSASFDAGDAIELGFADYFLHRSSLEELRRRLSQGEDPATAVAALAEEPPPSKLNATLGWFHELADSALGSDAEMFADPKASVVRLVSALEASARDEARALAGEIRGVCPTSVVVALAQLARARAGAFTVAQSLMDDFRILGRLMVREDFPEGARAQLIDKDGQPRWNPARLEDVDEAEIARILDPNPQPDEPVLAL